mgnify:FL=1
MPTLNNENLLTIEETAEIFKTKSSTIRSWIRRKDLPQNLIFKVGGIVRIRKQLLEKFIAGE